MATKRGGRVCVIGAGTAGLCAIKHSLEHGLEVTCYEQTSELGGTWVYQDINIETVECDEDIQSSMYSGLRTNLPKEVMGYPDFDYPDSIKDSFVTAKEVLEFLQLYADHFNLHQNIKFLHTVIRVRPTIKEDGWEVYVRDNVTNKYEAHIFDYIFVCNGHYTIPLYPNIESINEFQGRKLHSHLYRKPEVFKDENILLIGCGPSAMDIANHVHKYANHIYLSHHLTPEPKTEFMKNVTQKPDVERFTQNGVIFKDGSSADLTVVIFCTGYRYTFPFLSTDCGIRNDNNWIYPLYKHVLNINYPTMAFIGIPYLVLPTQTFDLQVRFALSFYTERRQLPSRDEMMADLEQDVADRKEKGIRMSSAHQMGEKQYDYYRQLAELAGIKKMKPVIQEIMKDCRRKYIYELDTYRNYRYVILDDENFEKYSWPKE